MGYRYDYIGRHALECENELLRDRIKLAEGLIKDVESLFEKSVTSGISINEICALRTRINEYYENR